MESMIAVINLENEQHYFNELASDRNGASMPFASQYRLIDFTLSNIVQSQIKDVAIFTRSKYRSLIDHLGAGEQFGLDLRKGGLFIFVPDWNHPADLSRGDLQFFYNHRDYFLKNEAEYVLIGGSQFLTTIDYRKMLEEHIQSQADITLLTTTINGHSPECSERFRVQVDEQNWVTQMSMRKDQSCIFSGTYIINKQLLLQLIDECVDNFCEDLFIEGIYKKMNQFRMRKYEHTETGIFIHSLESYFRHHMNLLHEPSLQKLIYSNQIICSKSAQELPTVYQSFARVKQSMVGNGCKVNGDLLNSVIFANVHIKKGARLRNCIILDDCTIGEGAYLENVIVDQGMIIEEDGTYIGAKDYPFVIATSKVIS